MTKQEKKQTKQQKQQEQTNNNTSNTPSKVCSVHGAAHLYDVQCRMNPVWTSMYQYRQACKCGDVMSDWHS